MLYPRGEILSQLLPRLTKKKSWSEKEQGKMRLEKTNLTRLRKIIENKKAINSRSLRAILPRPSERNNGGIWFPNVHKTKVRFQGGQNPLQLPLVPREIDLIFNRSSSLSTQFKSMPKMKSPWDKQNVWICSKKHLRSDTAIWAYKLSRLNFNTRVKIDQGTQKSLVSIVNKTDNSLNRSEKKKIATPADLPVQKDYQHWPDHLILLAKSLPEAWFSCKKKPSYYKRSNSWSTRSHFFGEAHINREYFKCHCDF